MIAGPLHFSRQLARVLRSLVALLVLTWAWSSLAAPSVTLAWDPSPDTNVTSYVLYYGQETRHWTGSTNVGNTNLATVTGLATGTWFFVVGNAQRHQRRDAPQGY